MEPTLTHHQKYSKEYEYFCINKHRETYGHETYHWNDVPEKYLEQCGYFTDYNRQRMQRQQAKIDRITDYGLDGIAYDKENNVFYGLQMKYYDKKPVTAEAGGSFLTVFYQRLAIKNKNSRAYLYYSSSIQRDLAEDFKNAGFITPVHMLMPMPEEKVENKMMECYEDSVEMTEVDTLLWTHQKNAIEALDKVYYELMKTNSNNSDAEENMDEINNDEDQINTVQLLISPCGSGKSRTICEHLKHIKPKTIVAIAPLRNHVDQLMARLKQHLTDYKFILIDTDGTTNIEQLVKNIKDDDKLCICSTFVSAETIISQSLVEHLSLDCIVVDEAHNLMNKYALSQFVQAFDYSLLVTATASEELIDELNCDVAYQYPINKAIEDKIICDYEIILPVPMDEKDVPLELKHLPNDLLMKGLFNVNGMLYLGNRRCISYMQSIEECTKFMQVLKTVCDSYHFIELWTDCLTSDTSKKDQKRILEEFQQKNDSGKIKLYILNSVRMLDEAVDIPKCDSEFISYLGEQSSDVRCVQRMMRGSRYDSTNPEKINRLFMWATDLQMTKTVFALLREDDPTFHQKIKCLSVNYETQNRPEVVEKVLKQEEVVKNFINVECKTWNEYQRMENWLKRLEDVQDFMEKHHKRPSDHSKDIVEKQLGSWVSTQNTNYRTKSQIMKTQEIYDMYTKFKDNYSEYFMSNEEIWKKTLSEVQNFIEKHHKRPSQTSKDSVEKQLSQWLSNQNKNYTTRSKIMKNQEIYDMYTKFRDNHSEYLMSNEEVWKKNLFEVQDFIEKHHKRPSQTSKDAVEKQLGNWLGTQNTQYTTRSNIMKNQEIYDMYTKFKDNYSEYFLTNEDVWKKTLSEVQGFMEKHHKRPSQHSKDNVEKQLAVWIGKQTTQYKTKSNIMKTQEIHDMYTKFRDNYSEYLMSNEEVWKKNLFEVQLFMEKHHKRPSQTSKDTIEKQLGNWLGTQNTQYTTQSYIMKNQEIYDMYTKLRDNYSEYLMSNEEVWKKNLFEVQDFIEKHHKRPSQKSKDSVEKQLGQWLLNQNNQYTTRSKIMKNQEIYDTYTKFRDNYAEYLMFNEEVWKKTLSDVQDFIKRNHKRPSHGSKEAVEKQLASWLSTQNKNYTTQSYIMKNQEIYDMYIEFITNNKQFFKNLSSII
jgi:superfamily II DNA or RNA helicase